MIDRKAWKAEFNGETQILLKNDYKSVLEAFDIGEDPLSVKESKVLVSAKLGYLTDKGDFLTPEEALQHVLECGQLSERARQIVEANKMVRLQMMLLEI